MTHNHTARNSSNFAVILLIATVCAFICLPYPGYLGSGILRMLDVFLLMVVLALTILTLAAGATTIARQRLLYLLIFALLTWQVIVILLSETSVSRLRDLLDVYKQLLWFLCLSFGMLLGPYLSNKHINSSIQIALLISSSVAILQLVFGPSMFYYLFSVRGPEQVAYHYSSRVIGTLGNPNFFALFNIAAFFWAAANIVAGSGTRYYWYACLALAMVLLAQSRTGIVGVVLLLGVFLLLMLVAGWVSRKQRRMLWLCVAVGVVLTAGAVYVAIKQHLLWYAYSGFLTVYEAGLLEQSSFGARLKFWEYFADLIVQRPVFGYGPSKGGVRYAVADNNYIFIAFKYGVVGLALTLAIWMSLAFKLIRRIRATPDFAAVFSFFLLAAIMFSSLLAETMDSMRLAPVCFLFGGIALASAYRSYEAPHSMVNGVAEKSPDQVSAFAGSPAQ